VNSKEENFCPNYVQEFGLCPKTRQSKKEILNLQSKDILLLSFSKEIRLDGTNEEL
jgi:hypothetical protein